MSEITVRALTEDEWETYRAVRLAALAEAPDAFVADHDAEAAETQEFWRARMARSVRLLAEVEGESAPVGVVSIGQASEPEDEPGTTTADAGELFGLWVAPEWRGRSVAASLVRQGATVAAGRGVRRLYYWVGADNPRAIAFASSFGFRPTDQRRAMRTRSGESADQEIAMVLGID